MDHSHPHILIAGDERRTQNYINALLHVGATADACYYDLKNEYDGLLLPGGGDIDPGFWGESDTASHSVNREEDLAQFDLMTHFIAAGKPILGICKGMQVINVYFHGSILQDLPTAVLHAYNGADQFHMTYTKKDSFMESLYGKAIITNSAHHQGVGTLGRHLDVVAVTKDNVVEAIAHDTLPVIGVQWHPERMYPRRPGASSAGLDTSCTTKNRNVYLANGCRIFEYFLSLIL